MRRVVNTTRKDEVVGSQPSLLDPLLHGLSRGRCDLKLHRALGLVLHDYGTGGHLIAVADVPDLEAHEITAAKLAIDSQIEEGELAHPAFHLQANTEGPDVLEFEWSFLTHDLALVPWLAMNCVGYGSHDGLPSSLGSAKMRFHSGEVLALRQPRWRTEERRRSASWHSSALTLPVITGHSQGTPRPVGHPPPASAPSAIAVALRNQASTPRQSGLINGGAAQTQGIADHRSRAQTHRQRGDHWR